MLSVLVGIVFSGSQPHQVQDSVVLRLRPANGTSYSTETILTVSNSSGRILYAKIDHDIKIKVLPNANLRFSETVSKVDVKSTGEYVQHGEKFQELQGMEIEVIRNVFCDAVSATYRGMKWDGFLFDAFMDLHFPNNPVKVGDEWVTPELGRRNLTLRDHQMLYRLVKIETDTVTIGLTLRTGLIFDLLNCLCTIDRRSGLIESFSGRVAFGRLSDILSISTDGSASFSVTRKGTMHIP